MNFFHHKTISLAFPSSKRVPVFLVLFLTLILSFPCLSWSEENVSRGFQKLFKILEGGDSISKVLDRSRWPKSNLLSSYLELELLFHPRYRMTLPRLRKFLKRWPTHPYADQVRRRIEWRITQHGQDAEALAWYDKNRPKTRSASVRYLRLLLGKKRLKNALVLWKSLYRQGVLFPKNIQKKTKSFEKRVSTLEREARARKLLKKGKGSAFKKVLLKLPKARRAYFSAMEAASYGQKRFFTLIKKLSPKTAATSELWDTWARSLYRKDNKQAFIKFILGKDSARMSDRDRRILRFRMGRTFYYRRNFSSAMTMLEANVLEAGGKLSDSLWFAAWSAHLHGSRKKALAWFIQLAKEAPVGRYRAQGAFWAARLSRSKKEKAKWLTVAAKSPGSFYGLLAKEKRQGTLLALPEALKNCPPTWRGKQGKMVRRLKLLKSVGRSYYIGPEIRQWAGQHSLSQKDQLCLASAFGAADLAIKIANQLQSEGKTFWNALYPVPDWAPSRGWKLDPALVWAATRQESLFYHRAESSAKALGLMQLIPSTARAEAKHLGLPSSNRYWLQLPAYNLTLGQSYLTRMLQRFDGDLVLAVSSYNAGPGRGEKWKKRRGQEDPLTFIENIPFTETRNYVKRVIHGLVMYRLQLYGSASFGSLLKAGEQKIPFVEK